MKSVENSVTDPTPVAQVWTCSIPGPPTTKKTGQRIAFNRRTGKPMVLPAARSSTWAQVAILTLRARKRMATITEPVHVEATFYRPSNTTGDLHGYMQALADALEAAGIIANDRLVVSWDGTRLGIDKGNPRVEVTIRWTA